jgi:integrase
MSATVVNFPHYNLSIARLVGTGESKLPKERYQDPKLQQTKQGAWFIRPWIDVIRDEKITRALKTIPIGVMGKREAEARKREIMATINRSDYMITSQIKFEAFAQEWDALHVARQSFSTRGKYRSHMKNHILPAFGKLMLCEVTTLLAQHWLDEKKLSWATKTDLRNILSCIFSCAIKWGRWKETNPIEYVHVGRKVAVRQQKKLSVEDTQRLLAALPQDVRLLASVCLSSTLRISEALGLQEKHLDFAGGQILVRQRFYRGDIDVPKNQKSIREVPMGYLADDLKRRMTGDPERFVFAIETAPEFGRRQATCRDDRDINQHFLRPAAKRLGVYYEGFGWHSLRREAITNLNAELGPNAVQRLAGHAKADMSLHYTLADHVKNDQAVRRVQERLFGKDAAKIIQ